MLRRNFLKKAGAAVAAAAVAPVVLKASSDAPAFEPAGEPAGDEAGADFKILSNEVKDGVRTVKAKTSAKVCSKAIDLQINEADGTIISCAFTAGCPGNTCGICRLVKGMKADEVSKLLRGTPCGAKGTSCPDQLARVIEALK